MLPVTGVCMTGKRSLRAAWAAVVSLILLGGLLVAGTSPAQAITAENIITRAQSWAAAQVPYSQSNYYTNQYGTYRTDCSGFVSMAWGLGQSLTTVTLPSVSHVISKEELQPGDVLLNSAPGGNGHVIIFAGWSNAAHTAYNGYESSPAYNGAHYTTNVTYAYWGTKYGTFTPYRYNNYENTPADRDHDGVPDASDRCPDQPGSAATGGCPDTDGDAVADLDDKCPLMPGLPGLLGCSEEDINPTLGPATDFDGDSKADYCRRVGGTYPESRIQCTLSTGDNFGKTITSPVLDWGYDTGRAWIDFNGDSKADYCRRVGANNNVQSRISCTVSTGDGFGKTVQSPVVDWGYDTGRAWVGSSLRYPRTDQGTNPPPGAGPGTSPQAAKRPHRPRKITTKRLSRTKILVRWKRVPRATSYRIRLANPRGVRTSWRQVQKPRATLHLPKGRHATVAVRAVGRNGLGPVSRRRV